MKKGTKRSICRKGLHDLTNPANIQINSAGRRQCRICLEAKQVPRVSRAGQTHTRCKNGHELTAENIITIPSKVRPQEQWFRRCKACYVVNQTQCVYIPKRLYNQLRFVADRMSPYGDARPIKAKAVDYIVSLIRADLALSPQKEYAQVSDEVDGYL